MDRPVSFGALDNGNLHLGYEWRAAIFGAPAPSWPAHRLQLPQEKPDHARAERLIACHLQPEMPAQLSLVAAAWRSTFTQFASRPHTTQPSPSARGALPSLLQPGAWMNSSSEPALCAVFANRVSLPISASWLNFFYI
jgi:hypothetical protein